MKADRADYPDSKQVRGKVAYVFEHKAQQFLTSITWRAAAQLIARDIMPRDVLVKCALVFLCRDLRNTGAFIEV